MNRTIKLSWLFAVILFLSVKSVVAQTKEDLFSGTGDITWLGLDFTQAKFIGSASQFKDHGEVTSSDFKVKFIPAWNQLFVDEKKYNLSGPVHRAEVKYALDVTGKANGKINKDFISNDPSDYTTLDAEKVAALVKKYDFQGKKGIGLIVFVEGMSKAEKKASSWVAYVNMNKKTVILSSHIYGKAGGFGFRDFWAKAFFNITRDADYKDWK